MKGNIIYKKTIPARSPEYAEFPKSLHPDIQDFLSGQNIKSLYTHQAEAFSHAMAGENIVITTPTASGKSLCFYLPVVQEILKDPVTRAIFIYPTKALAADQYRALIPGNIVYLSAYMTEIHRLLSEKGSGNVPISSLPIRIC